VLAALEIASGEDGAAAAGHADGLARGEIAGAFVVEPGEYLASGDGDGSGEVADADPGVAGGIVRGVALEGAAGEGKRDREPAGGEKSVRRGPVGPAAGKGDSSGGGPIVPAGVTVSGLPGPFRPAAEVFGVAGGIDAMP
jgi:hypothetical protein